MIKWIKIYYYLDRIFESEENLSSEDYIIYLGNHEDKLLSEICLRYANKNKVKKY